MTFVRCLFVVVLGVSSLLVRPLYAESIPVPSFKPQTAKDGAPRIVKKKPVPKPIATKPQPLNKKAENSNKALSTKDIAKLYYKGSITQSYKEAGQQVRISSERDAKAAWIAGLSAWRLNKYKNAAAYFERAAMSSDASVHLVSAAAYWAGRANMRAGNIKTVSHWYNLARRQPETFYGLLATRALGVHYTVPPDRIGSSVYINESNLTIRPELIKSIVKQESKFNPHAQSPSGATGLMQILPSTASYVTGDESLKTPQGHIKLQDPAYNLRVGQKYLKTLLHDKNVQGNLLYLLIAYNAGPGNLAKWKRNLKDVDDGLLFIESIPSSETRAYIERVLTYYWLEMLQNQKFSTSLDALAAGQAPMYPHYKVASKR